MTRSTERLALVALALAACSRKDAGTAAGTAEAAPSSSVASAPSPAYSSPPPPDAGAASLIAAHFAGVPSNQLETTSVELTSPGRRATLVKIAGKPTSEAKPFLYVSDEDGEHVLWSRDRPVAGITPPVGPIALSSGPGDRVSIAACDPPTGLIALRVLDTDGAPFADFQAMSNETCEAVALSYWRKHGWLLAIARTGATRAQLVKENGSLAWIGGVDVGVRSRENALAPPSLAFDTQDTFLVTQIAQPTAEPGSPFHALVFRYDAEGMAIWPHATDIPLSKAAAGQVAKMQKRYDGVVITLPERSVVIKPSGAFEPLK
jgi:hypothetical protein